MILILDIEIVGQFRGTFRGMFINLNWAAIYNKVNRFMNKFNELIEVECDQR